MALLEWLQKSRTLNKTIVVKPWLARFLCDKDAYKRSTAAFSMRAFYDKGRPGDNPSVDMHKDFGKGIHWRLGRLINKSRHLRYVADIRTSEVRKAITINDIEYHLDARPVYEEPLGPHHAEIIGWPTNDPENEIRRGLATILASRAQLVEVPEKYRDPITPGGLPSGDAIESKSFLIKRIITTFKAIFRI